MRGRRVLGDVPSFSCHEDNCISFSFFLFEVLCLILSAHSRWWAEIGLEGTHVDKKGLH